MSPFEPQPGPATYQPQPYQPQPEKSPTGAPPATWPPVATGATWYSYDQGGAPARRRVDARWLVLVVVVLLAGAGYLGYRLTSSDSSAGAPARGVATTPSSTAPPAGSAATLGHTLETMALHPGDFANGYTVALMPQGDQVRGQVTLDNCGFRFTTETHRVARRQYVVRNAAGRVGLSNELVAYDSPAQATRSLVQWHRSAAHCPTGLVRSAVAGTPRMHVRVLRNAVYVAGLPARANAVTVEAFTTAAGRHAYGIAVLQVRGRYLDAVYVTQSSSPSAADVRAMTIMATLTGRRLAAAG